MALRAKPPVLESNRFRALIYGNKGTGKTHFAASIPGVYFIDTEGVTKYKKFVDMLKENKSDSVDLTEITSIIDEVKDLIKTPHNYKTLVIDSITFPYNLLANMEVERLVKKAPNTEGTEFGANLAKAKRLTFHLAMLLTRLDMNVIVIAHEKAKFKDGKDAGFEADVNEKMGYALGTQIQLYLQGKTRKAYIEKSRYSELKNQERIDFEHGYEIIKSLFGEETFARDSVNEVLANVEQIAEVKRLTELLSINDEALQKMLSAKKCLTLDELSEKDILSLIKHFNSKITGEK